MGNGGIVAAWGAPGGGKSTWLTRFLDGIDGPVTLLSAEERLGPTVAARLSRLGVNRNDFHVIGQGSVDELVQTVRVTKSHVVAIDSIGLTTLQPPDLRRFLESSGALAFVFILQSTKDGHAAGSNQFLHEADVVMRVATMEWEIIKSRYQQTPVTGKVVAAFGDDAACL